jgi:putative transposase
VCTACGYTENADINAAKNILARGHQVLNVNDQQTKKQNRRTRGVSLRSESRQRSATETNLTQSLQAA